jgi:hypothetical protein
VGTQQTLNINLAVRCSGARIALRAKPANTLAGVWSGVLGRRTDRIVCPLLLCLSRSHTRSVRSTVANKIGKIEPEVTLWDVVIARIAVIW